MFCSECGKEIPVDSRFCPYCGAAVANDVSNETDKNETAANKIVPVDSSAKTETVPPSGKKGRKSSGMKSLKEGQKVTDNIFLCKDGIYRWVYEMPMLKNPTILYTTWKVLGISFGIVFLLTTIFTLFENGFKLPVISSSVIGYAVLAAVFLVISIIAYIIVAATYDWKYIVLFEMSDTEIKHIQIKKQHKKAEMLGLLTALAGLASGRITTVGIGINSATRYASTSDYCRVKSIKAVPRRNLIKLSQGLSKNQIYADKADFDFVLSYLHKHCPQVNS